LPDHINPAESVDWCTPPRIVEPVHEFFGGPPDLDPCSNSNSIVQATVSFALPEHDGLVRSWDINGRHTKVYVNPPFGRCYLRSDRMVVYSSKQWTRGRKLFREWEKGGKSGPLPEACISDVDAARFTSTSVHDWVKAAAYFYRHMTENLMLLPASVDTSTWQETAFPTATVVCWIKGRITFLGNVKGPAPMACAILGCTDRTAEFLEVFSKVGTCQILPSGRARTS
jgi:hypothetical protein